MRFETTKETLQSALATIGTGISRAAGMPILNHLMIRASEGEIQITASDTDLSARIALDADVHDQGDIAVPAGKMNNLVKALSPDAALSAKIDGDQFVLQSGRGRFALSTLPAREFMEMQPDADGRSISISADRLTGLLSRVCPATAIADNRAALNGVLLKAGGGILTAVATDAHRLAKAHTEIDSNDAEFSIIVPRKAVTEILRILRGRDNDVSLSAGPHALMLEAGSVRLVTRLIDGQYPNYEAVIPRMHESPVVLYSDGLKAGLARVGIVSDEKTRSVAIAIDENRLTLGAGNGEVEAGVEHIELEKAYDSCKCAFNLTYLNDAIGTLESELVQLHIYETPSPSLITADDDPYHTVHAVMPIKL